LREIQIEGEEKSNVNIPMFPFRGEGGVGEKRKKVIGLADPRNFRFPA